jgi:hypothetical protein
MPKTSDDAIDRRFSQRRSQRLLLRVRVETERDAMGAATKPEPTETLAVNAHGALLLLTPPVDEGQKVLVKNTRTGEKQDCKVVYLGALEDGRIQVGVEFTSPCPEFWRVVFPPDDWSMFAKGPRPAHKT